MKKNIIFTIFRVFISIFFIYLIARKLNYKEIFEIIRNSNLLILTFAFILLFLINFLLALRFKYILEIYFKKRLSLYFVWKITMIGLFFNNFLPTSAGGDIVKIFYVVKEQKQKFLSGISILLDRYIGSLTVMTMGAISISFYQGEKGKIYHLIFILFFLLIFVFYFFSKRKVAVFFYSPIKKFIPSFLNEKLLNLYNSINFYFIENTKKLYFSILISFFLQFLSILSQYLISFSITGKTLSILPFFIFIPLVWVSTLIPSLGGLGIREFSYIFLFSDFLGKNNAYALSLLCLLSVILNSIIGGFIFLSFRNKNVKEFKVE
ncbi:MAG: flippase-like domain-containing protein [Candidatus Omnitrophica bacterium]|nr:flippase-like domain-containing protein [Candidatus Omnitrophota bacterium]